MPSLPSLHALSTAVGTRPLVMTTRLREHYERLGTASVDDQFDDRWKEHVEKEVKAYSKISSLQKDTVLDRRTIYAEIKKCSKA